MVRLMRSRDDRFKLPASHFASNDLVLTFPPPPPPVYNPFNPCLYTAASNAVSSAHYDPIHFGRMRKWLIQSYPHVTWIFKGYDDFYPRDQAQAQESLPSDSMTSTRLTTIFVNNIYAMYEVSHWKHARKQNRLSKKLLRLVRAAARGAGHSDMNISGYEEEDEEEQQEEEEEDDDVGDGDLHIDRDLLPFFEDQKKSNTPSDKPSDGFDLSDPLFPSSNMNVNTIANTNKVDNSTLGSCTGTGVAASAAAAHYETGSLARPAHTYQYQRNVNQQQRSVNITPQPQPQYPTIGATHSFPNPYDQYQQRQSQLQPDSPISCYTPLASFSPSSFPFTQRRPLAPEFLTPANPLPSQVYTPAPGVAFPQHHQHHQHHQQFHQHHQNQPGMLARNPQDPQSPSPDPIAVAVATTTRPMSADAAVVTRPASPQSHPDERPRKKVKRKHN